jgi:hypothetical protein
MLIPGLTNANAPSTTKASYLGPLQTGAASEAETTVRDIVPVAGVVSNLAVNITTATGNSGKSWTFTVRKNGAATGVTCQISGSATFCTSSAAVAFSAGDLIALEALPAGNPPGWTSARWAVTLTQ